MPGPYERTGRAPVLLLFVLLLVLGSFGLLVAALVTGQTAWAWGSVVASLLAGALLVVDWLVRRRATADAEVVQPRVEPARAPAAEPGPPETDAAPVDVATGELAEPVTQRADPPTRRAEPSETAPAAESAPGGALDPDVEPNEEDTDAADVFAVSDLTYEVVVIDERPRYHLAECEWLASRETIPLPVREARELGFTPCALCTPDAELAERHRLARR